MKIAIVDDDVQMYNRLCSYLNEFLGELDEIMYYSSGEAFLSDESTKTFDLIILDIFMNGITGMDVAVKVRKNDPNVKIAFCTSSNEFASESYEVNACYYLHKPFGSEQVKTMLSRINLSEIEQKRTVKLPDGTNVALRKIICVDCSSHMITLHCKNRDDIVFRASFSEIERLLCSYPYFISPSKGIIINFYEVAKQNRDTFVMSDKTLIPISRRKAPAVLEAYSSFMFAKLRKGDDR